MLDLFLTVLTFGIVVPLGVIVWGIALWCLVEIFRD